MKINRLFSTSYSAMIFLLLAGLSSFGQNIDLADQVTIRRTAYGVPHITADNMLAAGYAIGYLQMEDYGFPVVEGLIKARGDWSKFNQPNPNERSIVVDQDASNKLRYERSKNTFSLLFKETQDILEGFAKGMNRYIELHPKEFAEWVRPDFTGIDVHARDIGEYNKTAVKKFLTRLNLEAELKSNNLSISKNGTVWSRLALVHKPQHIDVGSNAWALGPSRTTSGKSILLRNPHLNWDAGYYEAHLTIPGKLDFYGDFRVGSPLETIGGFNKKLGFSTTNNHPDTDEVYAFKASDDLIDHYELDGEDWPLKKETVKVLVKNGNSFSEEVRIFFFTPYGPVIHRDNGKIYIVKDGGEGQYRQGEQFLQMMLSRNLEEYIAAMKIQSKPSSNFTYADSEGNIYYVWNAMTPDLPHPSGGDTVAIEVQKSDQIWKKIIPFENLPQLLNPKGGYIHNENDPFHYTNLNEVLKAENYPANFSRPQLRLRSQHALSLIANGKKFSLEDIVRLKFSNRLLLADRVKQDLINALKKTNPKGEVLGAINHLERWDNTVNYDSKGGILFEAWWDIYVKMASNGKIIEPTPESAGYAATAVSLFKDIWTPDRPTETPKGLANENMAVKAFTDAINFCKDHYGSWDFAWGDINRAQIGDVDLPASGATGDLGSFAVLWFEDSQLHPKKRRVKGGDCWVLAVEFDTTPRAYSVLAYGQSTKKSSPFFGDQLSLFVNKKMKPVLFNEYDVKKGTIKEYKPGKRN